MDIKQGKEDGQLFIRKEEDVAPSDDQTGNLLFLGNDGKLYIQCIDLKCFYEVDFNNNILSNKHNTDFLEWDTSDYISGIKNGLILCESSWGRVKLLDENYNLIFKVEPFNKEKRLYINKIYYDYESDVIFYRLKDGFVTSLLHPTLNDEENKKNYHNAEETLSMLKNGEFGTHLSINENNNLIIDGKVTPFGTYWYGNYRYQVVDKYFVNIWKNKSNPINFEKKENEISESIAIHPCGDIYRLVYNSSTQLHTLYRVENTWDPQWRQQWYAEHSSKE